MNAVRLHESFAGAEHRGAAHGRAGVVGGGTRAAVASAGRAHGLILSAAMARAMFRVERPTVALLNIGVEEIKGVEEVKQAHAWLKEAELPFDYRGFVEASKDSNADDGEAY